MLLFDELHRRGNTIILVTHEDFIAEHADRIIKLRDGLVESDITNHNRRIPKAEALTGSETH
jgi:putative ABC transport system ATP-binding protein